MIAAVGIAVGGGPKPTGMLSAPAFFSRVREASGVGLSAVALTTMSEKKSAITEAARKILNPGFDFMVKPLSNWVRSTLNARNRVRMAVSR